MLQYNYDIVINGAIDSWRWTNFNVSIRTSFLLIYHIIYIFKTKSYLFPGFIICTNKIR